MNPDFDSQMMARALQLARYGRGFVSPNPMVGAVITTPDGRILGEGWHRRYGGPHAEVNAVNAVNDRADLRGATIYVSLEPCSHYGKTPPCAEMLVRCGFGRVVVGTVDPNPKVAGRGIAMLREAGIAVDVGVLREQCERLNSRFFYAHTHGMPWVLLKWAQTAGGVMAMPPGMGRLLLSSPQSTILMHRERAAVDAIVVGAGTVRVDDPSLTVRFAECRRQPLRVVLASSPVSLPASCRVLSDGLPTVVFNTALDSEEGVVTWVKVNLDDPREWLSWLFANRGCISVMVEGGATVLRHLINTGCWQQARVETVPASAAQGVAAPTLAIPPVRVDPLPHAATVQWYLNSSS